jgi:hypothetical protein
MAVVGFQDTAEGGQQRVVVRDVVGGLALKEDEASAQASQQLPPDGGVGKRCLAGWSRFVPEKDELDFPRNAEIKEAEQMNEDWFWGVYAGQKGFFPGNHVMVLWLVTHGRTDLEDDWHDNSDTLVLMTMVRKNEGQRMQVNIFHTSLVHVGEE